MVYIGRIGVLVIGVIFVMVGWLRKDNINLLTDGLFTIYLPYILIGLGVVMIISVFKGWLEENTGTRF